MAGVPFALLSVLANAALPSQAVSLLSRSAKQVDDCGTPNSLRMTASFMQSERGSHDKDNEVLKSGFMQVTCIKDYMYYHGDKFGAGRHSYELGQVGVSIVHYDSMVKKEDREPMSPKVCFKFCRSVPNMSFFGVLNGRKCYCEPYYKAMAGDSSMCDAHCDGDKTKYCGGKSKSTIFSMHSCPKKDTSKKANHSKCKKCCWQKEDPMPRTKHRRFRAVQERLPEPVQVPHKLWLRYMGRG